MGYVWDIYGLYIDLVLINCGPTVDQLHSKGIGFAWFLHGVTVSKQVKSHVKAVQQVSLVCKWCRFDSHRRSESGGIGIFLFVSTSADERRA
jgi:hypothetical protein